jgi:hypothetical protein
MLSLFSWQSNMVKATGENSNSLLRCPQQGNGEACRRQGLSAKSRAGRVTVTTPRSAVGRVPGLNGASHGKWPQL